MVTERQHTYLCTNLAETAQSLADLMRRFDKGLVRDDEYHAIRKRLIRAALDQRERQATALTAAVRAVDWKGTWGDVFAPLKVLP